MQFIDFKPQLNHPEWRVYYKVRLYYPALPYEFNIIDLIKIIDEDNIQVPVNYYRHFEKIIKQQICRNIEKNIIGLEKLFI